MSYGKRMKLVREKLGFTQQELDKELTLKQDKTKNIETEKHKITPEFAQLIEQKYSFSGWWLLTGKGEMLLSNESTYSDVVCEPSLTYGKSTISNNLVEIAYYEDIVASAGGGAYNSDYVAPTLVAFDRDFLKTHLGLSVFDNIHIITSTGDSMEPTISPGELLFISPIENESSFIKEGGIYIIMCEDSVLVKRVSKDNITKEITLISDNKIYPPKTIKLDDFNECKILGRVIGHFNGL